MNRHLRRFWLSALLAAALCGLALHLWWAPQWRALPRAPFPFSRTSFLDAYGSEGIASHYLTWAGLFGWGHRMQESDVLLIGTSHVWFGLSASLLAQQLSTAEGHPVRVLNLGLGYADEAFQFHALARRHLEDKTVVIDLYCPGTETMSPWANEVMKADGLVSYVRVLQLWADGLRDWCLDPLLPRFHPGSTPLYARTFANTVTRRWDTGDADYIWRPDVGLFYQRGARPQPIADHPFSSQAGTNEARFWGNGTRGIVYPEIAQQVVKANHLQPLLVMMPFDSYRLDLAQQIAAENQLPLVLISLDGLRFFDWGHLNAPSRDIATRRLGDAIISRRLLAAPGAK